MRKGCSLVPMLAMKGKGRESERAGELCEHPLCQRGRFKAVITHCLEISSPLIIRGRQM